MPAHPKWSVPERPERPFGFGRLSALRPESGTEPTRGLPRDQGCGQPPTSVVRRLLALLGVAAELATHRGQDLVGELAEAARLEALVECRGDDRRGYALVHRCEHGPAAFAGVGHATGEVVEIRRPGQGVGDQVDQPGSDDRAAAPDLGDL